MRRFVVFVSLTIAAILAIAPAAQAALSVTMHATTHNPKAGAKWPITISAHNGKKKVCGHVRYVFLFNGKAVGHRNAGVGGNFCGHFKDPDIVWPKKAVGIPLTFRAVVDTKLGQRNLDYAVKVKR
jgi:hypothetical protein